MLTTRISALLAALGCMGCASPIKTAPKVDLPRYMGAWHVIACVDNPVERKFVRPVETYRLDDDGRTIHVQFHWRKEHADGPLKVHVFKGEVLNPGENTRWKMKLFPLFAASYQIIAVGDGYEWAAVAHPSRKFGWVLARQQVLSESRMEQILQLFAAQGYDPSRFIMLRQN